VVFASAASASIGVVLKVAKKLQVGTPLRGVISAAHSAFLEVGAVSLVLCHLCSRNTLMPSCWLEAHLVVSDLPAGLLAFSRAFNTCRATVYVPYRALNRVFPFKALQKVSLFSSAMFTMEDHCSLSPPKLECILQGPRYHTLL
jgi:hypothetical protein